MIETLKRELQSLKIENKLLKRKLIKLENENKKLKKLQKKTINQIYEEAFEK